MIKHHENEVRLVYDLLEKTGLVDFIPVSIQKAWCLFFLPRRTELGLYYICIPSEFSSASIHSKCFPLYLSPCDPARIFSCCTCSSLFTCHWRTPDWPWCCNSGNYYYLKENLTLTLMHYNKLNQNHNSKVFCRIWKICSWNSKLTLQRVYDYKLLSIWKAWLSKQSHACQLYYWCSKISSPWKFN